MPDARRHLLAVVKMADLGLQQATEDDNKSFWEVSRSVHARFEMNRISFGNGLRSFEKGLCII